MSILRSLFSSRKSEPATHYPKSWPSPLHHKCNQPDCWYPNSPQVAKGVYVCQGVPGGFYCEGTYKVSTSMAEAANRYFQEEFRIDASNKRRQRLMEKRRYEEDHYTHANVCHHDEHPKVKLAMNPNVRYENPGRRRLQSAPESSPLSTAPGEKSGLKDAFRLKRSASEGTSTAPSLHRSQAQRRNASQECAIPGVRQYYQHHTPSRQPPPPTLPSTTTVAQPLSDERLEQTSRSITPQTTSPKLTKSSHFVPSENRPHARCHPSHYSEQSRSAQRHHLRMQ